MGSFNGRAQLILVLVAAGIFTTLISCSAGHHAERKNPPYVTSGQFTTAHPNLLADAKDYFDIYPTHVPQPIAFTHKIHLQHGMRCTDCHKGAAEGPDVTIPNVSLCMTCHQVIATNKPEIKKIAAYQKKGDQILWHRVYWFYQSAHVKFRHGPHIRAKVKCATCHGNMRTQTVAVRKAGLDMHFCVSCHRLHNAPTDCTTCHF